METILPVENGETLKALQGFLKKLLETGTLDVLLVPMRTPGGAIVPALVSNPELLSQADPLAPVLPVNSATLAGKLSSKEAGSKVGVVLRACELRALVELVKLQQAHLEDLTLIALDCAGTYSVPVYQRKVAEAADGGVELWQRVIPRSSCCRSRDAGPGIAPRLPDLRAASLRRRNNFDIPPGERSESGDPPGAAG